MRGTEHRTKGHGKKIARNLAPIAAYKRRSWDQAVGELGGTGKVCPARADAAMQRYAEGDDAAFGELYDLLAPRLTCFLRRHLRREDTVEDLLQQTLLHMHRARGSFIPGAAVTPWAFAIARRLLIDRVRRGGREVLLGPHEEGRIHSLPAPDAGADDELAARELARRLHRVMLALPEPQRSAYELVKFDGLRLDEAAQVLGVSLGAIKQRLHRATETLRVELGTEA